MRRRRRTAVADRQRHVAVQHRQRPRRRIVPQQDRVTHDLAVALPYLERQRAAPRPAHMNRRRRAAQRQGWRVEHQRGQQRSAPRTNRIAKCRRAIGPQRARCNQRAEGTGGPQQGPLTDRSQCAVGLRSARQRGCRQRPRGVCCGVGAEWTAVGNFLRDADRATTHALLVLDRLGNRIGGRDASFVTPTATPDPDRTTDRRQPDHERRHARQRQPPPTAQHRDPDGRRHAHRQGHCREASVARKAEQGTPFVAHDRFELTERALWYRGRRHGCKRLVTAYVTRFTPMRIACSCSSGGSVGYVPTSSHPLPRSD